MCSIELNALTIADAGNYLSASCFAELVAALAQSQITQLDLSGTQN